MGSLLEQRTPLIGTVPFGMQSQPRRTSRFWGLINVRPLTVFIGVFEIFVILCQALIAGSYLASSTHRTAAMIHMTVVVLTFIAVFLLIAGIFYRVPLLLGPHLLMQAAVTLILSLLTLLSIGILWKGTSVQMRISMVHKIVPVTFADIDSGNSFKFTLISSFLAGLLVLAVLGFFISSIFSWWSIRVVLDCYWTLSSDLQDKAQLPSLTSTPVTLSSSDDPKRLNSVVIPATDF